MSTQHHVFIQPQDILILRGNKLFGDAGSYGESLIPPWPSVAAGALRSRMFADGTLPEAALTDPAQFTLTGFELARRNLQGKVETLHALPADLLVQGEGSAQKLRALTPTALVGSIQSSAALNQVPVLAEGQTRQKSSGGWWLTAEGWARYLSGHLPQTSQLVSNVDLWKLDARVGVGLDTATRRADDGKLFTTQAVALRKSSDDKNQQDVGFVASARAAQLPTHGLVRIGGDGRAAQLHPCAAQAPALPHIKAGGRFKLILTTPGIFDGGWMLAGVDEQNLWHGPDGCTAQLVCAAVARADVVSGWDLAQWKPKTAQRVAPTGSVYWLENFQGDAQALQKLGETGLWGLHGQTDDPQRKAEGFNRCTIGAWV